MFIRLFIYVYSTNTYFTVTKRKKHDWEFLWILWKWKLINFFPDWKYCHISKEDTIEDYKLWKLKLPFFWFKCICIVTHYLNSFLHFFIVLKIILVWKTNVSLKKRIKKASSSFTYFLSFYIKYTMKNILFFSSGTHKVSLNLDEVKTLVVKSAWREDVRCMRKVCFINENNTSVCNTSVC